MRTLRKQLLLSLALVAGVGCVAAAGTSQADAATAFRTGPAQTPRTEARKSKSIQDIPAEWNALFQSSRIDALIKRAFSANPDAGAVQAALRRGQEYPVMQQGFFYPAVVAGASVLDGQEDVEAVSPTEKPGTRPDYFKFHSAQLMVGYEPEVLGSIQKDTVVLQMQAGIRREASYFTLASNVVAAAIQEAALRAQIEAQLNIVGLNRQSLEIVHNQFKLGYVSEEEVRQHELDAANAQQVLVPLQQQLEQVRDLLAELAGDAPDEDVTEKFTLDELRLSRELPQALSSDLVEQRPDVRMAETQLYAAGAQYGVTVANMMPRFTITGATGGGQASPKWMLKTGGRFFDLKGNVAQGIFDARALRAKPRDVQMALSQAGVQYRNVVMSALQEVADTLNVIAANERALRVATKVARAAGKTGEQTRKQYEAGSADFQTLLTAQQNEQLATISLVQAQSNRAGDSIALFQALGGRWWKREETDLAKARLP